MQAGDKVRIIKGANEGKVGEVLSGYPIEGLENGDFSSLWFVGLEDGGSDIIQEDRLEVIGPD
ncbi:MAG: hypothetical protein HYU85_06070 [Chloroflexi bacterium]|nr:hypothetical protein [Chloroflexota bacterium]